ncbi:MAG TPA: hypothetical protein VMF66_12040 [Candidatus Acidoferrum sp.]|nr:hypothetical protein [Candidatus Acidoferrum sp.]
MIGKWVAVLLLASPAGIAAAQRPPSAKPDQQQSQTQDQTDSEGQQDPLAAAARLAREQQKNQARASKVWDNDNLPAAPVSTAGSAAAGSMDHSAGGNGTAGQQEGPTSPKASLGKAQKTELQGELTDAKAHLKSVETDLDIATRTYQLDQETYYSNPNHDSDTGGAAKLRNEQSDIDTKKQAVADAQKKVDDLNAKLQEAESQAAKSSKIPE